MSEPKDLSGFEKLAISTCIEWSQWTKIDSQDQWHLNRLIYESLREAYLQGQKSREIVWPSEKEIDIASSEFLINEPTSREGEWYSFEAGARWLRAKFEEMNK